MERTGRAPSESQRFKVVFQDIYRELRQVKHAHPCNGMCSVGSPTARSSRSMSWFCGRWRISGSDSGLHSDCRCGGLYWAGAYLAGDDLIPETRQSGIEPLDQAHTQARVPERDGSRGAVGRSGRVDDTACGFPSSRPIKVPNREIMLRARFMLRRFGLSDPATEEAVFDVPPCLEFVDLDNSNVRSPTYVGTN